MKMYTYSYRPMLLISFITLLYSCVTNYPNDMIPPPWTPENVEGADAENQFQPSDDVEVPVYFSEADVPVIDGEFDEWLGLDGPLTRLPVFGGSHVPEDAEAFFVLRTDGASLYVYSRVSDDVAHENYLPGSMAWRADTVELFFGTTVSKHRKYTIGDNQIRLVPRSKEDRFDVDVVVNQRTVDSSLIEAAAIYTDGGYSIEAAIPLSVLMIDSLEVGRKIRCDFQVNDADDTERDRMVHWMSDKDTPWFDPSVWGNGRVVDLPEVRKESPDEL